METFKFEGENRSMVFRGIWVKGSFVYFFKKRVITEILYDPEDTGLGGG